MGPSNINSVLKGKVKVPIPKCRWAYCPSGQHIMMHPFMKCLNGQQLWHFIVVSVLSIFHSSCSEYNFKLTVHATWTLHWERWLLSLWPTVEGKQLYICHSLHVQYNSLTHYARCLKLITFVIFLFRAFQNCKTALSETTLQFPQFQWLQYTNADLNLFNTSPVHLIWHLSTTTSSPSILTVMLMLLLLWTVSWRYSMTSGLIV